MEAVFELVKALSKSEKAHFRKYAQLHSYKEKSDQLTLFDFLDKTKAYNEDVLKRKLKLKNYAFVKFSLYEQIQSALREYIEKNNTHLKALGLLQSIEIMISKNLINQAETLNQKLKKIALKEEDHFILSKVLQNELKFLCVPSKIPKDINKHIQVQDALAHSMENYQVFGDTLFHLSCLAIPVRQSYDDKNPLHDKIVAQASKAITSFNEKNDLSVWNTLNIYRIMGTLHGFDSNIEGTIEANKKMVALMETRPSILQNNPRGLFGAYRNLFGSCIQGKKWDEAQKIIEMLKTYFSNKAIEKNNRLKGYLLETYLAATGYFYANKPKLEKHDETAILSLTQELETYKDQIQNLREESLRIAYYYLAIIAFRVQKFNDVLSYVNEYKLFAEDNNRFKRVDKAVQIIQLVSLFENEDYDVADSLLRSIKRAKNPYLENNLFVKESIEFVSNEMNGKHSNLHPNTQAKITSELDIALKDWLALKN